MFLHDHEQTLNKNSAQEKSMMEMKGLVFLVDRREKDGMGAVRGRVE